MERFFGIDLRGLAVMRILLGVTLLYDLACRAISLEVFLTDQGVYPVSQASANIPLSWVPSVHLLSGSWGFQVFLLALHALAALAFLVGRQTRLATVLCWFLTASLHFRNEMILNGGDYLLRTTLFWCMFLPMGCRYSWDAYKKAKVGGRPPTGVVANMATAGLLFQICVLYWGSAMNKDIDVWLLDPQALYYALNLDPFTSSIGVHLREATGLLAVLTVAAYFLEWLAPIMVLLGRSTLRILGISLLVSFHLAVAVLMQVGLFWLIPLSPLIAFLPGSVWDRILPEKDGAEPYTGRLPVALDVALATLLVFLPYLNLSLMRPRMLPVASPLYAVYRTLGFHYGWNMFARVNHNLDGWYVIEARSEDGQVVDLLTGVEINYTKPSVSEIYTDQRWRRYMADLYRPQGHHALNSLAVYLAKKWASKNGSEVEWVRVHYMVEETPEKPQPVEIEDRVLFEFAMER
jgi:hypothetical protein